jgi:hypothetical protein
LESGVGLVDDEAGHTFEVVHVARPNRRSVCQCDRRDPRVVSEFLAEPGRESSVNPVGLVIIRKNAASPSPQVIEPLLEQLETWD